MNPNVTVGIAGHIDHGKTSLTKALTNIDTDRLIEEKRRKISIENGYAFIDIDEGWKIAVIDVPGHERFIRQMIAGVAGIDFVLLVIAADEGIMPQTREHLAILRLLGIENAIVVLTKSSLVDQEWLALVRDDVTNTLKDTPYESSPIYSVDSMTGDGIGELRVEINEQAKSIKGKRDNEPLRLPIDDYFTLHGHGTIVRGTIFNGCIKSEGSYHLLPQKLPVRVKQMQVHHETVDKAVAGNRVAVNIGGISLDQVKRGDVIVSSELYKPTTRIDVVLHSLQNVETPLNQRSPIMFHLATSAVRGRLIMYDRNRLEKAETIYAQIELEEPVVAKKGDRFILRRPTPVETLGGGQVLNPLAEKHRFGEATIHKLEELERGTPTEWVETALKESKILPLKELTRITGISESEIKGILEKLIQQKVVITIENTFSLSSECQSAEKALIEKLDHFHKKYPLRIGMNRAEWTKAESFPELLLREAGRRLVENSQVNVKGSSVALSHFTPHFPPQWKKRMESVIEKIVKQGLEPSLWDVSPIPESIANDFRRYLLDSKMMLALGGDRLISSETFYGAVNRLKEGTQNRFTISEAKDILGLSRKNMIPFLELCDELGLTERIENERQWRTK